MRSAAATVAAAGADLIDLNMGCPVPKVCRTGAGAALLGDADRAVALARAAARGSGLPVTVKLRSGWREGERDGIALAHRLVDEAGVAAIAVHPRAGDGRAPRPPRLRARRRARAHARCPRDPQRRPRQRRRGARRRSTQTGAAAVMLARARSATRGCSRRCSGCATGRRGRRGARRARLGDRRADRAHRRARAPAATCAASTRGTSRGSGSTRARARVLQSGARAALDSFAAVRELLDAALARNPPDAARYTAPAARSQPANEVTCRRTSSSPQRGSRSSSPSSISSPPRSAARSPSGSRRPASSAISPRTPSTTTPRTSRRCSRRGSRPSPRSCGWRR